MLKIYPCVACCMHERHCLDALSYGNSGIVSGLTLMLNIHDMSCYVYHTALVPSCGMARGQTTILTCSQRVRPWGTVLEIISTALTGLTGNSGEFCYSARTAREHVEHSVDTKTCMGPNGQCPNQLSAAVPITGVRWTAAALSHNAPDLHISTRRGLALNFACLCAGQGHRRMW
jgi:hypothetical protein